jgi:hypothetical protein
MVFSIDMRTLSLAAGLVSLFCCLPMVYVLGSRNAYPGMGRWALGTVAASLGLALIGLRGVIPDAFSVVAANTAIVGFVVLATQGLLRFVGRTPPYVLDAVLISVMALVLSLFHFVWPSYSVRVVAICAVYAAYSARALVILRRDFSRLSLGRNWLLNVTFGLSVAWYMARIVVTVLFSRQSEDLSAGNTFQAVSTVLALGAVVAVTSGFVIVSLQRMRKDLSRAESRVKVLSGLLPTCSSCHKVRDADGRWINIEVYVHTHSEASFTHGLCEECAATLHPDLYRAADEHDGRRD